MHTTGNAMGVLGCRYAKIHRLWMPGAPVRTTSNCIRARAEAAKSTDLEVESVGIQPRTSLCSCEQTVASEVILALCIALPS